MKPFIPINRLPTIHGALHQNSRLPRLKGLQNEFSETREEAVTFSTIIEDTYTWNVNEHWSTPHGTDVMLMVGYGQLGSIDIAYARTYIKIPQYPELNYLYLLNQGPMQIWNILPAPDYIEVAFLVNDWDEDILTAQNAHSCIRIYPEINGHRFRFIPTRTLNMNWDVLDLTQFKATIAEGVWAAFASLPYGIALTMHEDIYSWWSGRGNMFYSSNQTTEQYKPFMGFRSDMRDAIRAVHTLTD